jgi:hypothetical protein
MPRTTRKSAPTDAQIAAAIAALPFDFSDAPADAPHRFANLAEALQVAIAKQIATDRAAGLSGNDLRAKYSGPGCPVNSGLSGPLRRKVLRTFGYGSVIARSYEEYSDGDPRKGSSHAKEHGPHAAQRQADALAALAQADADRKAEEKAMRAALRKAGRKVPRAADALRAAYEALPAKARKAA